MSVSVNSSGQVQLIETVTHTRGRSSSEPRTGTVIASSPNHTRRALAGPTNDPSWNYDGWNAQHRITRSVESWALLGQGEGAIIAVIDSGVNGAHPDLVGQTVPGWDFVDKDADTSDPLGHGTHVAGIIAAKADNNIGIVGLMPKARIMPLRVLGKNGSGSDADIAKAIIWAADHGAHAINLSLGGAETSPVLDAALDYARSRGTLPVCAAGNTGGAVEWPGASASCLPVRALDMLGTNVTEWSSRGLSSDGKVHGLSAPGVSIWSTHLGADIYPMDGTSMATPAVAAVAGMLIAGGHTPASAQAALESSARDIEDAGPDGVSGYGALDMLQLGFIQTGQSSPVCKAKVLLLVPGKTDWATVDLGRVCSGRTLRVSTLRPESRVEYIEADGILHYHVRPQWRWHMNRFTVELVDTVDLRAQPMLLTIITPAQPGWLKIEGKRCGTSPERACRVKYVSKGKWRVQGTWAGKRWASNTAIRLQLVRTVDDATDSSGTRMSGPRSYVATVPAMNFDPGLYSVTPSRGRLRGHTFYVRTF